MDSRSLPSQLRSIIQKKTLQAAISKNYQELDTDALTLSIDMNYNRSNISRTLNNLNRGGFLIKVRGRPTYYLDRKTICDFYNLTQIPLELENLEQLKRLFLTEGRSISRIPITAFHALIGSGANESLQTAINSAMKAALYPSGLHAYLITGPLGTGKKSFCQTVFGMEDELRHPKDPHPPVWVDLGAPAAERALEELAAQRPARGSCVGFLNAEQASGELLSKLIAWCTLLAQEDPEQIPAYAILSSDPELGKRLADQLYPIPALIQIPELDRRSIKERVLFVLSAFQRQCDLLHLPVTLDRPSFQSFLAACYPQNLRSLNNAVLQACQNSYFRSYPCSDTLSVTLSDIPDCVFDATHDVQKVMGAVRDLEARVRLDFFKFLPQKLCPAFAQLREEVLGPDGRLLHAAGALRPQPACDTLFLQCGYDLKHSRASYESGRSSKTFQLISRTLSPLLPGEGGENGIPALYCGLFQHLSQAVGALLTKSYQPAFPPAAELPEESLSPKAAQLAESVESQFSVSLPLVERQYIHIYLENAAENPDPTRVRIAVLCHWSEIITVYQRYAASLLYENQPVFFSYKKSSVGRERELQLRHILDGMRRAQEGGGLVVISDGTPDEEFVKLVYQEIGRNVLFITQLSQEIIRKALMFFDDPFATLEDFSRLLAAGDSSHFMVESRITMRIKSLISDTLVFLDAGKVYNALSDALAAISDRLGLAHNDSLVIRFIVHSAFTIERAIRGECLPYKKADEYLRDHKELYQAVKGGLEPIQNLFNIRIPDTELAYLVEIFSDYV